MLANPTVRRRRPATLDLCRVELSLLASHCCSAADQAGHSLHTAQTGSHTGHTELAGQPHGATPYLWPATHPARTDRLEYHTRTVQSASHAGHKWIVWLDDLHLTSAAGRAAPASARPRGARGGRHTRSVP